MEEKLESMRTLTVRRDARLKQMAQVKPFIAGSLAKVAVKCGNPNCKCASGERHEAWILTRKERGKTVTVHVPRDMVEEVAQWVAEHKRLKKLSKEASDISERMIRLFVRTSRAAAQRQKLPKQSPRKSSGSPSTTTSQNSSPG